jgi:hypothetical protein
MSGAAGSCRRRVGVAVLLLVAALAAVLGGAEGKAHNYEDALQKSLLYFEAQRSGRLPHSQRVAWRHHSGLTDGLEQGVRTHARARARSYTMATPRLYRPDVCGRFFSMG